MKIIFMGSPEFAVPSLKCLYDAGHEILAVYTQTDKEKGRGRKVEFPAVKKAALELGLPVKHPVYGRDRRLDPWRKDSERHRRSGEKCLYTVGDWPHDIQAHSP